MKKQAESSIWTLNTEHSRLCHLCVVYWCRSAGLSVGRVFSKTASVSRVLVLPFSYFPFIFFYKIRILKKVFIHTSNSFNCSLQVILDGLIFWYKQLSSVGHESNRKKWISLKFWMSPWTHSMISSLLVAFHLFVHVCVLLLRKKKTI